MFQTQILLTKMNCATILNHVVGFQGELSEILQKRRSNKRQCR
eukprot:UN14662